MFLSSMKPTYAHPQPNPTPEITNKKQRKILEISPYKQIGMYNSIKAKIHVDMKIGCPHMS